MSNSYFDRPQQVVFADPDNPGEWIVGIAYKDEIICACCGGIFNIDDVKEQAEADGVRNAIYPYADWIDVVAEITGGEMPEGLVMTSQGITEIPDGSIEDEEAAECEAYYFKNLE